MPLDFSKNVTLPSHVCRRELDGESVLLNLETEQYHGLDPVGSKMLDALEGNSTMEAAFDSLVQMFEVEPERLRNDLDEFVTEMLQHDLLELCADPPIG